jgi:hypothetical protein
MIAERTAMGVKYKSLVNNSRDMITVMAITIFDIAVSHPALKFTALRENEPTYMVLIVNTCRKYPNLD